MAKDQMGNEIKKGDRIVCTKLIQGLPGEIMAEVTEITEGGLAAPQGKNTIIGGRLRISILAEVGFNPMQPVSVVVIKSPEAPPIGNA